MSNKTMTSLIVATATFVFVSVVFRSDIRSFWQQRANLNRVLEDWRTPIAFYGKVVDQSNSPVAGAVVEFVVNDLSREGTTRYNRTSDSRGFFSLIKVTGKALTVTVHKEGYNPSTQNPFTFIYSGENQNYSPNATAPETFILLDDRVSPRREPQDR